MSANVDKINKIKAQYPNATKMWQSSDGQYFLDEAHANTQQANLNTLNKTSHTVTVVYDHGTINNQ